MVCADTTRAGCAPVPSSTRWTKTSIRCHSTSGLRGARPSIVPACLSRVCAYPPRPPAPFDASGYRDRHMPCRGLRRSEVRAITADEHRTRTPTLNACESERPPRRQGGRGAARHPVAGLTCCYCAGGQRWILLTRLGSGRHTGVMEGVGRSARSSERNGAGAPGVEFGRYGSAKPLGSEL
jgi:hypothetical protein